MPPNEQRCGFRARPFTQRRQGAGRGFHQVLVRFALERILYRLSQSEHANRFLLKGALLFAL
mgnify:CR=1 FL=1